MLNLLIERVNTNKALVHRGRFVNLSFVLGIGSIDHIIEIQAGKVIRLEERRLQTLSGCFAIRAAEAVWEEFWQPLPKRDKHDLFSMVSAGLATLDGDLLPLMQNLQYFKDVLATPRLPSLEQASVQPRNDTAYESIIGRYFTMEVAEEAVRIYVEEAGSGIPLVCLHTAGADGRQFRHLMNDPAITDHFRVLAFDMPWHGKSNPPDEWREQEYQLTRKLYQDTVLAFCQAMALEHPVIMGCSMGGRLCLHLALEQPDDFRAVIALEGADRLEPYYNTEWLNRSDVHGGEICAAFVSGQVAPQSPEAARWETLWMYMQGGPGIFKGDLYFYWIDGHFDDRSEQIDTRRCPVYLLSGEYDSSCTPERTQATASRIKGAKMTIMEGMGHFPMSENPQLFRSYILPVLQEIREEKS